MHKSPGKLPPLDTLKGFDAAARHLSFTRAAGELFLTQSAISRQIQTLEEQLGVKLFRRGVRSLTLTKEGAILHAAVSEVLLRLAEVCASLHAPRRRPRVTVSSFAGIAALWLVPRLSVFQDREPGVDVLLITDNRVVDLDREDVDLALRYASPDKPPTHASLLFDEVVFPVLSPRLAAGLPPVLSASDLAQLTLLTFDNGTPMLWLSWEPWLQGMGLAQARPKAVLQFNQYDQLIHAAQDGRGIALARGPLVTQAIAEGKLQPLNDARQRVAARGYFLVRTSGEQRPEVDRFAAWLLEEGRNTAAAALG